MFSRAVEHEAGRREPVAIVAIEDEEIPRPKGAVLTEQDRAVPDLERDLVSLALLEGVVELGRGLGEPALPLPLVPALAHTGPRRPRLNALPSPPTSSQNAKNRPGVIGHISARLRVPLAAPLGSLSPPIAVNSSARSPHSYLKLPSIAHLPMLMNNPG